MTFYEEVKAPETPTVTEAEVIFLESRDIHTPQHTWKWIQTANEAKQHDEYARKYHRDEPKKLTPELEMLAGICQKVTFNAHTRDQFKRLYASCFARGFFRKDKKTGDYVFANSARIHPYPTK